MTWGHHVDLFSFILDCEPGKGLEHTSGGPKCNNCETGK